MRTFNTYSEAMTAVLPNYETLRRIGKRGTEYFREKILTNKVSGRDLSPITKARKALRGASSPDTKLFEGGGLADQLKFKLSGNNLKLGYFDELHNKFSPKDKSISVSYLAAAHDKGNSKLPARKILEDDDEFIEIISDEIQKRIAGIS